MIYRSTTHRKSQSTHARPRLASAPVLRQVIRPRKCPGANREYRCRPRRNPLAASRSILFAGYLSLRYLHQQGRYAPLEARQGVTRYRPAPRHKYFVAFRPRLIRRPVPILIGCGCFERVAACLQDHYFEAKRLPLRCPDLRQLVAAHLMMQAYPEPFAIHFVPRPADLRTHHIRTDAAQFHCLRVGFAPAASRWFPLRVQAPLWPQ